MTAPELPAETTDVIGAAEPTTPIRPFELFTRNCQALWGTTYGLDISLVNEFLLAQLGDPPINLTVLADATRLADTLLRTRDSGSLAAVNRRWLLRGVRYGTGAFHPKSYLAVTPTRATLLVGSGNLNTDGLGAGKEVFTRFATGTPHGDAAVRTWMQWSRRLVTESDDVRLAERFDDLNERLLDRASALNSAEERDGASLLHNLDEPLLPQFVDHIAAAGVDVDELLLTAPFYDEDVRAAGELVERLAPHRVQVWAAAETNVNGKTLVERLGAGGAQVSVWRYQPHRFVHAKLAGVVAGGWGWILSGSPNLSRAALTLTPSNGGNVELAVIAKLPAARLMETYHPPGTDTKPWPENELAALAFTRDPDPEPLPVRLHNVELASPPGQQRVRTTPSPDPAWLLTDGTHREPLQPTAPSAEADVPWPHPARLVWICDNDGQALSNRTVADDLQALAAALRSGVDSTPSERPAELHLSDTETPLGQLLEEFHRNLIMDVSDLTARSSAADATQDEAEAGTSDELWDRLRREEVVRDPRVGFYWAMGSSTGGTGDALLDLLELLRNRAPGPAQPRGSPFRATVSYLNELAERWHTSKDDTEDATDEKDATKRRWSAATRVRVRARNVLRRWADAQSEPEFAWVDALAPVKNLRFAALLLAALYALRWQDQQQPARPPACPLTHEDLADLSYRWIAAVVGSGTGDGWMRTVDTDTRDAAVRFVDDTLAGLCAGLAWLALTPGTHLRQRLIHWQPVVHSATRAGLMTPHAASIEILQAATGEMVTVIQVTQRLDSCRDFIDDDLWCERTAAALGLSKLRLDDPPAGVATRFGATLHVDGIDDPLTDPRTVRLIAATRRYRRKLGVAVYAANRSWRLAVPGDDTAAFMPGVRAPVLSSDIPIDADVVALLLEEGGVLTSLFTIVDVA